jgi:MarR family transcriptional regulator for hemolysin
MTIATVAKHAEPMSQTELASKLGVEDPTMVSMLDRLVKAGYLLRQPSGTDRRVKLIVLTAAGQQVYETVRLEATTFRKEILHGVDPAKLAELTTLLEHLQAAAEAAL